MKKVVIITLSLVALATAVAVSAFTESVEMPQKSSDVSVLVNKQSHTINMFVSHGHCSLPFSGTVNNLLVSAPTRDDLGNPLEGMELSFEIDPHTFTVCSGDEETSRIRTPGLFTGEHDEKISFKSTEVYTMGLNWYQVNGKVSIKGKENNVKFFLSGVRDPAESSPTSLVLEGQLNLFDWGIDYDKIVTGESDAVPTKWMHLNMQVNMD